jgi:hypothetical protein
MMQRKPTFSLWMVNIHLVALEKGMHPTSGFLSRRVYTELWE